MVETILLVMQGNPEYKRDTMYFKAGDKKAYAKMIGLMPGNKMIKQFYKAARKYGNYNPDGTIDKSNW